MKLTVVLNRRRRAPHIKIWLLILRTSQQTVADLRGPILIRRKADACRTRIPLVRVKVITILIRLTPVEDRSFDLEPPVSKAGRKYAKGDVRRVLQVVRECRRRVFRSRSSMHERHRTKCGLAGITKICEPRPAFAHRESVLHGQ